VASARMAGDRLEIDFVPGGRVSRTEVD
jgi:hypothetical protein